jgi:hypothetical protein
LPFSLIIYFQNKQPCHHNCHLTYDHLAIAYSASDSGHMRIDD